MKPAMKPMKKLVLESQTVRNLSTETLSGVVGGGDGSMTCFKVCSNGTCPRPF